MRLEFSHSLILRMLLESMLLFDTKMMLALEHKLYLRHLYINCKKVYDGGTVLKDLILSIAKATYMEE
ncbi:hypothetical protein Ahy_B02g061388 [Arachis hypogaea]|uniref:Uncharacterized protein n=1 Tax=Arachis hypogaea TaxID=3818 RepID=A0A445AL23_ARAHY|nr:hypothetical protein Ahy_B02g061388 [Arachis hypogaea]